MTFVFSRALKFQRRLLLGMTLGSAALLGNASLWAAGAPPAAPPAAASEYPPDPNDPTPAKAKAAVVLPPADPARVAQGKQLFKDFCQKCHGIDMVSPGPPFFDLRTFPHDEKPRFVDSVTNGKRAMPAWGAIVKPADIELLWTYVSSYPQ
jgi:mono/diheme cytochrome c family protein